MVNWVKVKRYSALKLIWLHQMSTCVIRFCIVYCILSIIKQAINGKSTRCTIMPIRCLMRLKASHIRFVLWNSGPPSFYDWVVEKVHSPAVPRQYESSRLNVDYTITSKRKLRKLVEGGHVHGWDDPRMPTVVGMRRRGFTPEGLRDFCKRVGVSKTDGIVDVAMLEFCIRQSLENSAARGMAVLNPLKVTLTNLPEAMDLVHVRHPNVDMGERSIPLTSEIYIDRKDFEEVPPKGFKRLIPDGEVRLRHAYIIKCDEVIKDEGGEVVELKCSIDTETLGKIRKGVK